MKYVLICILLFLSLFSINSQDAIEITIGSTTPIKESSKIMKYYFKYSPKEEDAYIKVCIKSQSCYYFQNSMKSEFR